MQQHADVGIAFDGDGDRIGVVDSSGAIVWPDQLLLLLALEALETRKGVPVVADVKSAEVSCSPGRMSATATRLALGAWIGVAGSEEITR